MNYSRFVNSSSGVSADFLYERMSVAVVSVSSASSFLGMMLGSALCLIVVTKCRLYGTKPTDVYVITIATADLLQSGVYLPSVLAGNIIRDDIFGKAGCVFFFWTTVTSLGVILLCHCTLAIHWMLLTFSNDMNLMKRKGVLVAWIASGASWVVVGCVSYGASAKAEFLGSPNYHCGHKGENAYMYAYFAVTLVPSQILTPVSYIVTYVRVVRFRKSFGSTSNRIMHCLKQEAKKEFNLFKSIAAIFGVFEFLYVGSFLIRCTSENVLQDSIGNCMLYMTSIVNGPLMLGINAEYRNTLRDIFQRKFDLPSLA